jgi:hypothetical protein
VPVRLDCGSSDGGKLNCVGVRNYQTGKEREKKVSVEVTAKTACRLLLFSAQTVAATISDQTQPNKPDVSSRFLDLFAVARTAGAEFDGLSSAHAHFAPMQTIG